MASMLLALALVASHTSTARAELKFRTEFRAAIKMPNGSLAQINTDEKKIRLPVEFVASGWHCDLTEEILAKDGDRAYRNLVCSMGKSSAMVGVAAACSLRHEDSDTGEMFLRAGDTMNHEITFFVGCKSALDYGNLADDKKEE